MAQTFTRSFLSTSQIGVILSSSTSYATIHYNNFGTMDEVWLYASNSTDTAIVTSIGWCSTLPNSNNGLTMTVTLPARSGPTLIIPGLIMPSGYYIVGQAAAVANSVFVNGFVNRVSTG